MIARRKYANSTAALSARVRGRSTGLFLAGAAVLIVVAGLFGYTRFAGPALPAVPAIRTDLVQTVVATGRVITPARLELGTVLVGTIDQVLAREGNMVPAGGVLATLKDAEARAALVQARGTLAEAEARLGQIGKLSQPVSDQALKQAEANFGFARDELERTKRLAERGFFSVAKVEDVERNLAVARAARESALAQAVTNRPQGSEYALVLARRAQARAALDAAQARLDNTVIKSPVAGTVLKRVVEPGDVVTAGKILFEVAADGPTQLVLQVDEKNLGLLRIGQEAKALADAYPDQRFPARIFYISPGIDPQRGSVEVKLLVREPPPFIRPDMTVSVEIATGSAENVIVVPSDMIRDAGSNAPWVMVVRDWKAVRQTVKLGLRGVGRTELREGIEPGEPLVPPAIVIAEGARVRTTIPIPANKPALKPQEIFR